MFLEYCVLCFFTRTGLDNHKTESMTFELFFLEFPLKEDKLSEVKNLCRHQEKYAKRHT
jgi:hypothetical protein